MYLVIAQTLPHWVGNGLAKGSNPVRCVFSSQKFEFARYATMYSATRELLNNGTYQRIN